MLSETGLSMREAVGAQDLNLVMALGKLSLSSKLNLSLALNVTTEPSSQRISTMNTKNMLTCLGSVGFLFRSILLNTKF